MKKLIGMLVMTCAVAAFAAPQNKETKPAAKPRMTSAERIASMGGFVVRPGSLKGSVAFIDTQKKVAVDKAFNEIFDHVRHQLPIQIDLVKEVPGDPMALKAKAKANFAVVFVDDAKQPSMTVYPEDGVAVVNVAKYTKALKLPDDTAIYEKRCAKGALKAFVMLCNGGGSRYPGNVATTHAPEDLDLAFDKLPVDIQDAMKKYLEAAGVTPARRSVYRKACEEGWAPAPTNDVQKAIWEKVHQLPTEPIRILPEKKPVKE